VESYHGRHTRGHTCGGNDVAALRRAQVGPEPVEPLYYTVLLGGRRHAPTTAPLVDAASKIIGVDYAQATLLKHKAERRHLREDRFLTAGRDPESRGEGIDQ